MKTYNDNATWWVYRTDQLYWSVEFYDDQVVLSKGFMDDMDIEAYAHCPLPENWDYLLLVKEEL